MAVRTTSQVNRFFEEELKIVENLEKEESKKISEIKETAEKHLEDLNQLYKRRLWFIDTDSKPPWFEKFKSFLSNLNENPRSALLEDVFILKQLESLPIKASNFWFLEFKKYFLSILFLTPILLMIDVFLLQWDSLFWFFAVNLFFVFRFLFLPPKRDLVILTSIFSLCFYYQPVIEWLITKDWFSVLFQKWHSLTLGEKFLLVEAFSIVYALSESHTEAYYDAVNVRFSIVYEWLKKFRFGD
ncbi:hypothetical protein [Phorcysia thermohydrogeniphila]|uniref:Uncharacterized protein n=1 Tax=Phorcysia thermohydrogeniphila TaxID=936138 RepID=A0A4R1G8F8_9BACT|nr:hypothetical protein [Phorcysia thermohydrogeniphila]TCK02853.1 hypothetical protein CLV27_1560 [Phorcysia thermohydrogeniphila]